MAGEIAIDDATAISRLVQAGDLDTAEERLEDALRAAPSNTSLRLSQARLLAARGERPAALTAFERLHAEQPANGWVTIALIDAAIDAGDVDGAVAAFRALAAAPATDGAPSVTSTLQRLAGAIPDAAERRRTLEALHVDFPESAAVATVLALQLARTGIADRALALLVRAERSGPLPGFARTVRRSLAGLDGNHEAARRVLLEAIEDAPDVADPVRRLIRIDCALGRFDEASARLEEAVRRWPDSWLVLYRWNRTPVSHAVDRRIHEFLESRCDAFAQPDLWRFQFAAASARLGDMGATRALLETLRAPSPAASLAEPMRAAIEAPCWRDAPDGYRIAPESDGNVVVVRHASPVATLVVFSGLARGTFYLPNREIDRLLSELPVTIVYLQDPFGLGFLRGIPDLGSDEADTVIGLRALVRDLGCDHVVTMGTSMGGYAAIRYGLALGARATLSFAGAPVVGTGNPGDPTQVVRHLHLGTLELRNLIGGDGDLRPAIAEAAGFSLRYVVGDGYAPDQVMARHVADLPNAEVVTLPGVDDHFASMAAIAQGRFLDLVRGTLGLAADPAG